MGKITGLAEAITMQEAIRCVGANRVYMMLRFGSIKAYSQEAYLDNLRLLIHLIRTANPEADIVVLSVLPGIAERYGTPSNRRIFRCNLLAAKICLRYVSLAVCDIQTNFAVKVSGSGIYRFVARALDIYQTGMLMHLPEGKPLKAGDELKLIFQLEEGMLHEGAEKTNRSNAKAAHVDPVKGTAASSLSIRFMSCPPYALRCKGSAARSSFLLRLRKCRPARARAFIQPSDTRCTAGGRAAHPPR